MTISIATNVKVISRSSIANFWHNDVFSKISKNLSPNWKTAMYWAKQLTPIFLESRRHFFQFLSFKWYNGVRCHGYLWELQFFAYLASLALQKHRSLCAPRHILGHLCWWTYLCKEKIGKGCDTPCKLRKMGIFCIFCNIHTRFHSNPQLINPK